MWIQRIEKFFYKSTRFYNYNNLKENNVNHRLHFRNTNIFLAACFIAALFSSCSTSQLSDMWRDSSYNLGPMTNVLVIAVKKNAAHRRIWEDGFASDLEAHGVTVTPSYRLFPADLPDTNQVIESVKGNGYDGVIVVNKLETEISTSSRPGYVTKTPVYRYNQWSQAYYVRYEREYHAGATDTSKVVRHEVNVWTTKEGGRMIWAGTGSVLDPASSKAVNDEIISLVVPELANQGIIPERK